MQNIIQKISMAFGRQESHSPADISLLYIVGPSFNGWYKKEDIHDYVKMYPGSIQVGISPYPDVIPAMSPKGEKYVKSSPNDSPDDNLLKLPKI